ncbi:MAG: tRNA (guanosine(46)-N7)-methyltransferase TrmB, partial [Clostridia bacterium]|nr:tRNA (guanosine(46)-N7)-methyltransferase TrmB [Clostridia bacterium]
MHKKSRLEERIAECGDIVKVADLSDKNMKRAALTPEYLPFNEIFGNDNPVYLEIGCGKGKFVCDTAKANPGVNFVAVEKISNVLIEALERARAENIK